MTYRVFFLGAGFSKALNSGYPTLKELTATVIANFQRRYPNGAVRQHFVGLPATLHSDIERLLTYLFSDWPWKSTIDRDMDRALYNALIYEIAAHLKSIAFQPLTSDLQTFVNYLGAAECKILTLNYDQLLEELYGKYALPRGESYSGLTIAIEDAFDEERRTSREKPWSLDDIPGSQRKRLSLSREFVGSVTPAAFTDLVRSTRRAYWTSYTPEMVLDGYQQPRSDRGQLSPAKILYLHGSVGWYDESGDSTIRISSDSGGHRLDRIPIIVPPVMDKSRHYGIARVRDQWANAGLELERAEEVVMIGFSLPLTDISCQFLLETCLESSREVRVVVVNRDPAARQRYESVLGEITGAKLDFTYCGQDNAVSHYVRREILRFA